MRLHEDERTSRAIILDEAFWAFADRGSAATIREIAAAARVSPALVIRHYGSKQQLLDRLDAEVLDSIVSILESIVVESAEPPAESGATGAPSAAGIGAVLAAVLPAESPMPAYLARMLIDAGSRGADLFERLFAASQDALDALVAAGAASPGTDPRVRAMVLLVADLATIMLRSRIIAALGIDPLSPDGLATWGREVLAIHRGGLSHD
jgi:AcrR family transcriptional regulator